MSLQINLSNFGIFKDNSFDLEKVTVFYGPNESGKTTLLDAIIMGTTNFGGRTKEKNRIKGRFPDAEVKVCDSEGNELTPYLPLDVMMDLLRNKARNMNLNYSENWTQKIKEELIAGGINPKEVIEEIRKDIEVSRKSGSLKIRMKEFINAHADATEKLSIEKNSLEGVLTEIGDMREGIGRRVELEQQKKEIEENIETLQENHRNLKNFKDYTTYKEILGWFNELNDLKEKLNNLTDYNISKKEEIENILVKQDLLQGQIDEITDQGVIEGASTELENELATVHEYESRFRTDTIAPKNKKYLWGLPIAVIFFGLAGTTWKFLPSAVAGPISGILAVVGLAPLIWTGFKTFFKDNSIDLAEVIREIKTTFPNESLDNVKTLSDIPSVLATLREKLNRSIHKSSINRNLEESVKNLKDILTKGIGATEYLEKITSKCAAQNKLEEVKKELDKQRIILKGDTTNMDLDDLKKDCAAKYESLDVDNYQDVPAIGNEDLARKQKIIDGKVADLNTITNKLTAMGTDIAAKEGQLIAREHEIVRNIVNLEKELKRCEKEKKQLELEEGGHRKLIEILEEVSTEVETDFSSLSDEVSKSLNSILGSTIDEPVVTMKDISDAGKLEVSDAGKSMRKLAHLSSGTRDAFVMTARMIMAKKAIEGIKRPIFTFDDTFLFMDSNRTKNAIRFLKDLVYEKQFGDDAYFVFFTKDKNTFVSIKEEFKDCTSYEL